MTIESKNIGNISEIILHRKKSVVDETFVGMLVPSMRQIDDPDYLLLDGSTFSQSDYPELYEIIGSTTLPDMTNRTVYGAGTSGRFSTHNAINLKSTNNAVIPAHTHGSNTYYRYPTSTQSPGGNGNGSYVSVYKSSGASATRTSSGGNSRTDTFAHSKLTYVYWYIVAKKEI